MWSYHYPGLFISHTFSLHRAHTDTSKICPQSLHFFSFTVSLCAGATPRRNWVLMIFRKVSQLAQTLETEDAEKTLNPCRIEMESQESWINSRISGEVQHLGIPRWHAGRQQEYLMLSKVGGRKLRFVKGKSNSWEPVRDSLPDSLPREGLPLPFEPGIGFFIH